MIRLIKFHLNKLIVNSIRKKYTTGIFNTNKPLSQSIILDTVQRHGICME